MTQTRNGKENAGDKSAPKMVYPDVTISDLVKKIVATDKQYDLNKILSA